VDAYGRLLCIKLLLFALLMVLAALNRRRYAPALARGKPGAAERFRRCVALEQVLIAVTLAVTAAMTGFYSPTGGEPETSLTAGS
jgi:putative copper resistance protein D